MSQLPQLTLALAIDFLACQAEALSPVRLYSAVGWEQLIVQDDQVNPRGGKYFSAALSMGSDSHKTSHSYYTP